MGDTVFELGSGSVGAGVGWKSDYLDHYFGWCLKGARCSELIKFYCGFRDVSISLWRHLGVLGRDEGVYMKWVFNFCCGGAHEIEGWQIDFLFLYLFHVQQSSRKCRCGF